MLKKDLLQFSSQFEYQPKVMGGAPSIEFERIIVCGMGGSQLPGDILRWRTQESRLILWRDYGLPVSSDYDMKNSLVVVISYSGNTEEALSSFEEAISKNIGVAVITSGGVLLKRAEEEGVSHVVLPNPNIQPRVAVGYSYLALLAILKRDDLEKEVRSLEETLLSSKMESLGVDIAKKIQNFMPVIYSSHKNKELSYQWKIALNETGKTPAFSNVFPEANHNELESFAYQERLKDNTCFVLLRDESDDSRVKNRMDVFIEMHKSKDFSVIEIDISRESLSEQAFSSLLLANWTGLALALQKELDPEQVPTIEKFKQKINR